MSAEDQLTELADRTYLVNEFSGPELRVLLHSHPASTAVLLDSGCVGPAFSDCLRAAAASGRDAADLMAARAGDNWICILRGGLNFLPAAADGTVSFIGTRRTPEGVVVDYERLNLTPGAVCVVGDIVATGATLCAVLELLAGHEVAASALVVVGLFAREGLLRVAERMRTLAPALGTDRLTIVALEAVFDLPGHIDPARQIQSLDFLRRRGPVCPEFARSWLNAPHSWFERCAVYDGGKRAFEPGEHRSELASYWRRLAGESPVSVVATRCCATANPLDGFGRWASGSPGPKSALERFIDEVDWRRFCMERAEESQAEMQSAARDIDKVAFICVRDGRILSTRTRGKDVYYIPGGKRESGESDLDTLEREIQEELAVRVLRDTARHVGTYRAQAHGHPEGVDVVMQCYEADVEGEFVASAEIAEVVWLTSADADRSSPVDRLILKDLAASGRIA